MKKIMILAMTCMVIVGTMMAGCGIAGRNDSTDTVYTDSGSYDDEVWYDTSSNRNKAVSILTDPSEYEHGYSSPYYQESTHDPRFENAELMCNYIGRTYSASYADLEFTLIDVSDDGNQIQVVFHKCQYEYTGIDLGTVYTGYLYDISGGYTNMDGLYSYEFPYMDEWTDGSRHEDTYYLEFSFGSNHPEGEFCLSEIGLLKDTMDMQ